MSARFSSAHIARVLQYVRDNQSSRLTEINAVAPSPRTDHYRQEEEEDSPIYDSFRLNDHASIKDMTSFTPLEFDILYEKIHERIITSWNVGRGKKTNHTAKDVLFMTLFVLKSYTKWSTMAKMFRMKTTTFQHLVQQYLIPLSNIVYDIYVTQIESRMVMKN